MNNEETRESLKEIKDNLNDIKEAGYQRIKDKYHGMSESVQAKREKMKDYTRSNPEQAMLMAAGAGFLAGVITALILASKKKY